ncbi:unnamed protein product, partial [Dovyalis caffra]
MVQWRDRRILSFTCKYSKHTTWPIDYPDYNSDLWIPSGKYYHLSINYGEVRAYYRIMSE